MYSPSDHYWIVGGDETRLYSSARFVYVAAADEAYTTWAHAGGAATAISSEAELSGVLVAAGLPFGLAGYASARQWALATGGYTATIAGKSLTFETNGDSRSLIDGKVSRLGQANPPATIKWQFPTGFVDLAAADFLSAAIRIADFVQSTFDALDTVEQQIAAGTLKTTADVDAFAWPTNHD